MSLARRHQERTLALKAASAPALAGGLAPLAAAAIMAASEQIAPIARAVGTAGAQIALRLQHDMRRLKEIKSIPNKIAAKRIMLPEYRAWIEGQLEAGRNGDTTPTGTIADEVLPTAMVWAIDIGDWDYALELAAHVLRHNVALPARYQRDAATLILEETAVAALNLQGQGKRFPLDVLEQVEMLIDGIDMHDEPRAKLLKAIGFELARAADASTGAAIRPTIMRAIDTLKAAQALHDRVGVKTQLKGLEKALAALPPVNDPAGTTPAQ